MLDLQLWGGRRGREGVWVGDGDGVGEGEGVGISVGTGEEWRGFSCLA